MKKLLSILCLCAMLVGLVGCNKHTPKICDVGQSGVVNVKLETTFRSAGVKKYVDEKAPKTATVEFMGQQYTGEYQQHKYIGDNIYPILEYKSENVSFDVMENGKLCGIHLPESGSEKIPNEEHLSEEEYIELAAQAAMQIADVTDWKVRRFFPIFHDRDGTHTMYFVQFAKYIGEIETDESVSVYIEPTGYIYSICFYMLGEFDEGIAEDKFDYEAIEQQVLERMKEICGPDDSDTESSYTVAFILKKEKNGKVVLMADASRRVYKKSEDLWSSGGYVSFIIR